MQVFRAQIHNLGWTDGDNVRIDYRWTAGVIDRFQTAAAELVALKPDVILADATPSVLALRRETQSIPIVSVTVNDPIGMGFVERISTSTLPARSKSSVAFTRCPGSSRPLRRQPVAAYLSAGEARLVINWAASRRRAIR